MIEQLSAKFDTHKKRSGGGGRELTYIAIDQMLNRANEVMGMDWSTDLLAFEYREKECVIALGLRYGDTTRIGVGASTMKDPDDRVKSALAEALKKALNQYGMGLYLWDEDALAEIDKEEFSPVLDLQDKKNILIRNYIQQTGVNKPLRLDLENYYKVDNFDEDTVDALLAEHSLD